MNDRPPHILAIGGSSRATSITANVLAHVLRMTEASGATTELVTVHDLDLPVYNEDIPFGQQPQALKDLLERMKVADGFLVASPTYHSSIGGGIKNVLDALHVKHGEPGTYFHSRPVGLIAYGGPSAINVITALLHTTRGMGGLVLPTALTVSRAQLTEDRTAIADDQIRTRAEALAQELVRLATLLRRT
jgi:FMN reductase